MPEIELVFEWDGKTVHKEAKGFSGPKCTEKTKFIEDALGKPTNRQFKSEYYNESDTEKEDENEDERFRY